MDGGKGGEGRKESEGRILNAFKIIFHTFFMHLYPSRLAAAFTISISIM